MMLSFELVSIHGAGRSYNFTLSWPCVLLLIETHKGDNRHNQSICHAVRFVLVASSCRFPVILMNGCTECEHAGLLSVV